MQRWSQRFASCVEGVGLVLALGGAFAIGMRASVGVGIGVFLLAYAGVAILTFVVRVMCGILEQIVAGLGRLLDRARRPDPVDAWPGTRPLRETSGDPVRPVGFHPVGDPAAAAPPVSGQDRLHDLARKAVDTLDLLTRRPLKSGDAVFMCLGRDGACGAAFHEDIRDDLRVHYEDRCPACGTTKAFVGTVLPAVPAAPPPLPELPSEAAAPAAPPAPPTPSPGLRPLVFRTAS